MLSLASMLLGNVPLNRAKFIPEQKDFKVKSSKTVKPESAKAMKSYQINASKPCAHPGCDQPRHKSKSGKCHTTLCTHHYSLQQERFRVRR
ncbi:hypothetical protein Slit_1966 [Sideroxydans lithotrophicus ES-1]|uniref:Uncharacterized protein n=1 Tax=Sideroxydans lithotrophicus (strain ES-1) TaxID=580332 RepID=D5CTA9_SIDLE|nr:hypothetical protein Slit_1966 [Sideroxydans lithotrophicus ES-1]